MTSIQVFLMEYVFYNLFFYCLRNWIIVFLMKYVTSAKILFLKGFYEWEESQVLLGTTCVRFSMLHEKKMFYVENYTFVNLLHRSQFMITCVRRECAQCSLHSFFPFFTCQFTEHAAFIKNELMNLIQSFSHYELY